VLLQQALGKSDEDVYLKIKFQYDAVKRFPILIKETT
jgi:hypothetical protein